MNLSAVIRKAIEVGAQHGFVTFDKLNELRPSWAERFELEAIEALLEALSDRGIDVREA